MTMYPFVLLLTTIIHCLCLMILNPNDALIISSKKWLFGCTHGFIHTKTPPALWFDSTPSVSFYPWDYICWALDCFIICSYAASRFFISYFTATSVSVICLLTAIKFYIYILISGTTSSLVFSISTPLINRQHFLLSSSLLIDSITSSFSFFSSSNSINFYTNIYASCYSYLYRMATFCSIYY